LKKWKEKITRFLRGRYGLDELGKVIFMIGIILYVLGVLLQNSVIAFLSMVALLIFAGRALSGEHWDRADENRKYQSYVKLWKLRYENRANARIYLCPQCGRYIRVPKGKGKIQITCPGCGNKMIQNT
jgi:DNA-directed RNA polymerase subunit RPC12/RpoP